VLSTPRPHDARQPTTIIDAESVAWPRAITRRVHWHVVAGHKREKTTEKVAGGPLDPRAATAEFNGIPWEGNYTSWLEKKRSGGEPIEREDKGTEESTKKELTVRYEWVRNGAASAAGNGQGADNDRFQKRC